MLRFVAENHKRTKLEALQLVENASAVYVIFQWNLRPMSLETIVEISHDDAKRAVKKLSARAKVGVLVNNAGETYLLGAH